MLTNTKPHKAILLSLIAFLSIIACNKMENETPSSLAMTTSPSQNLIKSELVTSTTGFPMIDLGEGIANGVNNSGKVVGQFWIQPSGSPHAYLWFKRNGGNDLGCFGYGPQDDLSEAIDINDLGLVVGSSWMPMGETHPTRAFFWSNKDGMVNLGTSGEPDQSKPPEEMYSYAFGINNKGEIVGEVDNLAFLWTKKQGMVLLNPLLPTWQWWSTAWDINDYGQIVGSGQADHSVSDIREYHAMLWTDVGEMSDLGTLKKHSQALGINNRGEVVGGSSDQEKDYVHERIGFTGWVNGFDPLCVPFIWTEQFGMSQLLTLEEGAVSGCANAINDLGQVVGWMYTAEGEVHAFLWTSKNGIKDLGKQLTEDFVSVAYAINNLGQVVGYSQSANRYPHAVIWTLK
jgi:probable HAF family extracellular repeat protein